VTDLVLISPSQVRTFQECPRKWAFDKIDQIPVATSPGAAFGSLVHKRLEGYFARGEDVGDDRAGKVARALATCYPPPPHGDMLVEKELRTDSDGFAWRGKIDLIFQEEDVDWINVCDHKTLRQPERYALDKAKLPTDVQAILYAHLAQQNFDVDALTLQWTYAATQGAPKPYPVRVNVGRENVELHLPALEATAKEILAARSATTANDLPPNLNACGNYGGCPYAEHCVRTKEQRMQAIFNDEESDMSSLREILQQRAGGAPAPPPILPSPVPRVSPSEFVDAPVSDPPTAEAQDVVAKKRDALLAPPRPDVNAPEAPKTEQERVDISKRVGAGEDARALVEASASGEDLDAAALVARVAAFKKKNPKHYEILKMVREGPSRFGRRKDMTDFPFAHGRTLNAMVKAELIQVTEGENSRLSVVTILAKGLAIFGSNDPVVQSAANAPVDDEPTTPADLAALTDDSPPISDADLDRALASHDGALISDEDLEAVGAGGLPSSVIRGNIFHPEDFDDAPPAGVTAREVWMSLAMKFGNDPDVVDRLYASYLRHFPTG